MKPTILAPRSAAPLAAIRLGQSDRAEAGARYGRWLVWFMRGLALLWMTQGLSNWALLVAGDAGTQGAMDAMSDVGAIAVIFFAVLDLIAAVGLWLAASWGGVVWLVAVAAQWFATAIIPGFFPFDVAIAAIDVVLVGGYFALTYRAAGEIDQ